MKILNLVQGSKEWLEARMNYFTASEAPAMMNESKYMSRTELLTLKKTGKAKLIDKFTQELFDKGHAAEESARQIIELDHFEELSPLVGVLEIEGLELLASFDGIREDHSMVWEHKLFNAVLAENVQNKVLEPHHYWQLEQQLLVSGANDALFTCSDGTEENAISMFYKSVPERRKKLIAGWKQFAKDLSKYEVIAKQEKVVANEIAELPKLEISLVGNVNSSNLTEYKGTALAFIQSINTDLETDQDFADAEQAVKFCKSGEAELNAVKEAALSDTADIKALFDTIDLLKEEMRQKRLTLDKLVKSRKAQIKNEIMAQASSELEELINSLRNEFNGISMVHDANFAEAMKNKRTIESLNNAVDSELSRCKIDLNERASLIRENLKQLKDLASEYQFLFSDWQTLVSEKNTDDLVNLIKLRISEHKDAKAKHEAEQREKIRQEEEAKLKAEEALRAAELTQIQPKQTASITSQNSVSNESAVETMQASEDKEVSPALIKQHKVTGNNTSEVKQYEPLALWPSDRERAENPELENVCSQLEYAEDHIQDLEMFIQSLLADKAA